MKVNSFFCPSDAGTTPDPTCGPTNYVFCTGDGLTSNFVPPAGDLSGANGVFIMSIPQSMATITDGSSNTAAASEQPAGYIHGFHVIADTTAAGYPPGLRARPLGRPDAGRLCLGRQRLGNG